MSQTTSYFKSIKVPGQTHSNIEEIGRHLADQHEEDVTAPRTFAVRFLVGGYLNQHEDAFEEKSEGQYVYIGGDGGDNTEETSDTTEATEKLTFSLSEGPPQGGETHE